MNQQSIPPSMPTGSKKKKPKGCLIAIAIVGFLIVAKCIGGQFSGSNTSELSDSTIKQVEKEKIVVSDAKKMENTYNMIKEDPKLLTKESKDATEINIRLAVMKAVTNIVDSTSANKTDSVVMWVNKIKKRLPVYQSKEFPILRKAYANVAKNLMWENDIDVSLSGNKNDKLTMVGGAFATNKNIKTIQESMMEMLSKLRFKKTIYKWYSGASEFTYFDIDSPSDSSPITE